MDKNTQKIAEEFKQKPQHVENVIQLLDEGNTVPFIARYRKEMHGTMDDQLIREIADRLTYLRNLDKRREEVSNAITEQGKMTEELAEAIASAGTLAELEDVYRPYKQKRRTRATVAREKGLEPLAELMLEQDGNGLPALALAEPFVDEEKGVATAEEAVAGACDIIAEDLSDNADIRRLLKDLIRKKGLLQSKAATDEDTVYRLYYDYSELVSHVPSHRVLAVNRGEAEKKLKVSVAVDEALALAIVYRRALKEGSSCYGEVKAACEDAYKRLIFPSVER